MHDVELGEGETPKTRRLWNGVAAAADSNAASENTESFILMSRMGRVCVDTWNSTFAKLDDEER